MQDQSITIAAKYANMSLDELIYGKNPPMSPVEYVVTRMVGLWAVCALFTFVAMIIMGKVA